MKPLCIDLFCGLGGWAEGFLAEGYDVIGVDNDHRFAAGYEALGAHFVLADVRDLDGRDFRGARCIVASPPCQSFSVASHRGDRRIGWSGGRDGRDLPLVQAGYRFAADAGVPIVVENVSGAVRWLGAPKARFGSRYLWGDVPPLIPTGPGPLKHLVPLQRRGALTAEEGRRALRAKIPLPLARAVARGFL